MQRGVFTIDEAAGEFRADFLDEARVRAWLFRKLNPAGPRCPHCGEPVLPGPAVATFWRGGRVCCNRCSKYFTASTGTMISGAALSEREIFLVALLLGFEVPIAEIAEILGRTDETVRFWRGKLALASELASPGPLEPLPPQGTGAAAEGMGNNEPFPDGFKIRNFDAFVVSEIRAAELRAMVPPGTFQAMPTEQAAREFSRERIEPKREVGELRVCVIDEISPLPGGSFTKFIRDVHQRIVDGVPAENIGAGVAHGE